MHGARPGPTSQPPLPTHAKQHRHAYARPWPMMCAQSQDMTPMRKHALSRDMYEAHEEARQTVEPGASVLFPSSPHRSKHHSAAAELESPPPATPAGPHSSSHTAQWQHGVSIQLKTNTHGAASGTCTVGLTSWDTGTLAHGHGVTWRRPRHHTSSLTTRACSPSPLARGAKSGRLARRACWQPQGKPWQLPADVHPTASGETLATESARAASSLKGNLGNCQPTCTCAGRG